MEPTLARRLLDRLRPGMLVLLDRAFDATVLLSEFGGLRVRIVEAKLLVRGADGSRLHESYRLITTLLDPQRHPAHALMRLDHERWEIESGPGRGRSVRLRP